MILCRRKILKHFFFLIIQFTSYKIVIDLFYFMLNNELLYTRCARLLSTRYKKIQTVAFRCYVAWEVAITEKRARVHTIIQCQWVNGNWRNLSRGSVTHTRLRDPVSQAAVVSPKNIAPKATCTDSSSIIEWSCILLVLASLTFLRF